MSDWYRVSHSQVAKLGGWRLFKFYSSLCNTLKTVYPEHTWKSNLFVAAGKIPRRHWRDTNNILIALESAEEKLGIQKVSALVLFVLLWVYDLF